MSFDWPILLVLLPLAPLFGWWAARRAPVGRRVLTVVATIGLGLLIAAIARPHATVSLPRLEGTLVLAFDNSNSMLATDASPTRIEAAQELGRRLVREQPSTVGVGVVSFSSGGVVLQQPTTRHELVLDTIDRLAPQGNTSLAEGLFAALGAVVGEPIEVTQDAVDAGDVTLLDIGWHDGAVIVLFTDGENRSGLDPRDLAALAANAGVRIFTVGVGETDGTTIEVDGFTLATSLNERTLIEIAERSEGAYVPAAAAEAGEIVEAVDDAIDLRFEVRGERTEVTALVAATGLLLVLVTAALSLVWFGRVG